MEKSTPSSGRIPPLTTILLASALLAATVLLFVPLRLFLGNFYEFTITFPRLLFYLLALALGATVFLALLVRLVPRRARNLVLLGVFALGAFAWLQSALNPGEYGVLNGSAIDWLSPANRRAFWLEAVLWLGGGGLIFGQRRRLAPLVGKISAILLATQLVGVAHLSAVTLSSAATPWWNPYSLDVRSKFTFSDDRNVALLVLDTFQATLFQQLMDADPERIAGLDGFIYYPDTVGGFPVTQPSIPVILTGTYYDNSVPYVDYVEKQFDGPALPTVLKRAGFRSETYPMVPITVYLTPDSADNLKKNQFRVDWNKDRELLARLLDIAGFQAAPQPIKKRIYADNHWFLQDRLIAPKKGGAPIKRRNKDMLFIEEMEQKACVQSGLPAFKFYHLNGIHAPLNLNENLEPEDMPEKRGSYLRQGIATLKILDRFLAKLKSIGAYDDALIVVCADHGFGPIGIHDPARGRKLDDEFYRNDLFMGAALPMLLVKPVDAHGELQTSAVQATLADIPKTVCAELGLESSFEGIAVTKAVPSETPRRRRWRTFSWIWLAGNDYLPPLREFYIEGNSWHEESWRPSRTVYEPGKAVYSEPEPIGPETVLTFGLGDNGLQYLEMGWGEGRHGVVWSTRNYASLGIPLVQMDGDLQLVFRWVPFLVPSQVEAQEISIYVNDQHLQDVRLTHAESEEYRLDVPKKMVADSFLKIAFRIPNAVSPASLGAGADQRTLGLALKSLTLSNGTGVAEADPAEAGD